MTREEKTTMPPTFLIIGAMKCGTTSLWHYLRAHPQIHLPDPKELNYFIDAPGHWQTKGWDWYLSNFEVSPEIKATGEASVAYTMHPEYEHVPERIATLLPDVELIYMVRDPIERMLSAYVHMVHDGYEKRTFAAAVKAKDSFYPRASRYAHQLGRFMDFFPRRQIHVECADELSQDPSKVLRRIHGYLGVDDIPVTERIRKNAGRAKAAERPVPTPELRARIAAELGPDIELFRKLTGKPFSHWSI